VAETNKQQAAIHKMLPDNMKPLLILTLPV
jgi:hypothetical protein